MRGTVAGGEQSQQCGPPEWGRAKMEEANRTRGKKGAGDGVTEGAVQPPGRAMCPANIVLLLH